VPVAYLQRRALLRHTLALFVNIMKKCQGHSNLFGFAISEEENSLKILTPGGFPVPVAPTIRIVISSA
jgi:hypothetical protein